MAQPHLAGKRVGCPSCGSPITIPAAQRPTTPTPDILVTCRCGQRFSAKPHLAGKTVRCLNCQQPIQVPNASNASLPAQVAPLEPPQVDDDLWGDLPTAPAPSTEPTLASAHSSLAQQHMANARADHVEKKKDLDVWGTGKILSGAGMMVGAAVWFVLGLLGGRIFFYPPIMFVLGAIALINGIAQKLNR